MNSDDDLSEPLYRVVCAAIRHRDTGLVICGARHCDSIMRAVALRMLPPGPEFDGYRCGAQGFINNKGEFLTREQAWIVAERAGQIRKTTGTHGTLYSEDLY